MDIKNKGISTQSVHGGENGQYPDDPLTMPIYQTATYTFQDTDQLHDFFQGKTNRVAEYGRYGNPTQKTAQDKLKILENAESCLLFSSGMNAVTTAILSLCKQGSHLIITDDSYRRTRQFIQQVISKFGIQFTFVKPNIDALEKAIQPQTKLLISESPTNPYLHVLDIEKVVQLCRKHKIKSMIDSTFATPYNQRPIEFGIDIVVHSITKYLGGHNDILGGALLGKDHLISAIKELQSIMGGVIDPHSCYLLIRGLKTFALRIERQNRSALEIAAFLEGHNMVDRVWYPGLKTHPDHNLAKRQMNGFGGVISFMVKGKMKETSKFVDMVKIPKIAPSLGGVETLIEQPALMSYYEMPVEERNAIGISDNLIRLSIGIEDTKDLIKDMEKAFKTIG